MRGIPDHAMTDSKTIRRTEVRSRTEAYRGRRRHGRILVPVEVSPHQIAALERLALLQVGCRDKAGIAWAVQRFLDSATQIAALGDALWPEGATLDAEA